MHSSCQSCLIWFQVILSCISAWEPDVCKEVHISSQNLNKEKIFVRDARGYPATVKSVTLLDQISEIPCVKWDTYGHDGFTVVAERGCEGKFRVCYVSGPRPPETPITKTLECTQVRLLSEVRRPDEQLITKYVRGGDLIVTMDLLRQLSAVSCVRGLSFNFYDHKVEARFGCRGDFSVCVDTLIILDKVEPVVKCGIFVLLSGSNMEERQTVPLTFGGIVSMTVLKEFSNNVCILGKTFGFNKNHGLEIYASNGCYAEFDVCQSPQDLLPPKARGDTI